jgi:hypothetical protein
MLMSSDEIKAASASLAGLDQTAALARVMATAIKAALAPLAERIAELEARPTVKYLGTWEAGRTYGPGDVITELGAMWHCRELTNTKPDYSAAGTQAWQLCVKAGRPGRDAR